MLRDAQLGERRAVRLEERVELLELGTARAAPHAAASAETSIARDAARSVAGRGELDARRRSRKRWLVTGHRGRTEDVSSFSSFSK